ncbi:MAG: tRNA adenosine(34) deaminase TadA [Oligoflexia bacterium]|nr:tRNA adenosine(34) deaminase TadA [Oligoflexia bacterium]
MDYMLAALEEAKLCLKTDDVPVGAIIVKNNQIIGIGRNQREELHSATAHAEVQAIQSATQSINSWNLSGTTMYVTLEPCPMCAGAIVQARIKHLIYGAQDPKGGSISLNLDILNNPRLNHRVSYEQGSYADQCSHLLTNFFKEIRKKKAQNNKPGP